MNDEIQKFLKENPPLWYYRWFPFLPRVIRNKELRMTEVIFWDCNYYSDALFSRKWYFIDVLYVMNPKWWQPNICGFKFWH